MNSQINPSNVYGGVSDTPLMLFQPFNIIVFLSFYSPLIISICMVSLSFVFQNFKGLVYLGYLIGVCVVRNYVYMLSGAKPIENDRTICSSIQYSKYGNGTFSSFVLAFTITYLSIPMFQSNSINVVVFSLLIFYLCIDIGNKILRGCIKIQTDVPYILLELSFGSLFATMIVMLMQLGGSSKFLFYTDLQNNGVVCSRPKKQTMKCSVYKNGQLVS